LTDGIPRQKCEDSGELGASCLSLRPRKVGDRRFPSRADAASHWPPIHLLTRPADLRVGDSESSIGKKPSPGAGAAQCGDGDVGVVGGEAVAEGQREKHAEWRAALRLRIEQPGEEHRFRCRLSPPDRLARADQPGKIERFGRYGDRSFSRATQRRHLRRGRNSRRVIRSLIGSAENSASCRKRICPLTSRIIHLPFASRSGHHTPICAFSCPRVGLSLPLLLEKLTDSAIIKVAP
jgi:hypothetical protein